MISKLLFTVSVIVAVILLVKLRSRPAPPAATKAPDETAQGFRWLALLAAALMVIGSAIFMWQSWRDASEVVLLKVIDTQTGQVTEFRAYRGDIDGRSFRTVDGRRITLAETDRLERSD
jgi:NADH:ubiquinone oxidoreductase subunit 2 (subunit N)